MKSNLKYAFTKAMIVLIPSYAMAFLTEKMVYVVPTLAAAGFFATSLNSTETNTTQRVDEDGSTDQTEEFDASELID